MDNKITLICNQCGSNDVMQESDDTYVCKNCGSKFKISQQVVNVFHTEVNGAVSQEDKKPIYLVTKEMSGDEFVKKALINIAKNKDIPEDIFGNTKFESAHKFYSQFLVMNVNYTGTYSASIGYDREEMYEDYEEKYDKDFGRNIRQKVMKKRIVTDWKPYSGVINKNLDVCVQLGVPNNPSCFLFGNFCFDMKDDAESLYMGGNTKEYSNENAKDIEVLVPTSTEKYFAIRDGEIKTEIETKVALPGDQTKDFQAIISSSVVSSAIYIVPTWEIKYKYNDENYSSSTLAYGDRFLNNKTPSDVDNIEQEINKKTKIGFICTIATSLVSIILSLLILFVIKSIKFRFGILFLLFASIASFTIYKIGHKKVVEKITSDRLNKVIVQLENVLSDNNLLGLTLDEKKGIFEAWGKNYEKNINY